MRTKLLLTLLSLTTLAMAQQVTCEINPSSVAARQDSTMVTMSLHVGVANLDSKCYIRFVPTLQAGNQSATLPALRLNGTTAMMKYRRLLQLTHGTDTETYASLPAKKSQSLQYAAAIATETWMKQASLTVVQELYDGNGTLLSAKVITPTDAVVPAAAASVASLPVGNTASVVYRGSYVMPEKDATDERNEREFHFTMDEARVIAQINPDILSLHQLYNVALSYDRTSADFYHYIDHCVQIHPTSAVANLNAAAAAIERGRLQAADEFLQLATRTQLAYTNNRGAYELMCNNIYEGLRLLKAAEAEGSADATHNLKIFFDSKKQR